MAKLVGAQSSEVVVMNSLTTNLHLLMGAFYRPTAERHKIITEKRAFPSDTHAVVSQIKFHGLNPANSLIEIAPRDGEVTLRTDDILEVTT
jgi:kynureninase